MIDQVRKFQNEARLPNKAAGDLRAVGMEYVLTQRFRGAFYIVVALIVYGSLYPFDFSFHNYSYDGAVGYSNTVSRGGDILGNIGLFVPFGVAGMLGLVPGRSAAARFVLLCLIGLFLAAGLQVLQVFLPSRHPALGDVAWNLVGGALGALLVWPAGIRARLLAQAGVDVPLFPFLLVGCWLISELAPFVPSIDLQSFKDSAKPLFLAPEIVSTGFLRTYIFWLVLWYFAGILWPGYAGTRWLAGTAVLTVVAKILIVQNTVTSSYVLAVVLAVLTWQLLLRGSKHRDAMILIGLGVLAVIVSLEPFQLRQGVLSFSWVPFSGALSGSMLTNVKAVASKVFLFGSMIYLLQAVDIRAAVATSLIVLLAAILEVAQIWIGSHTPEITDPLLVAFLGALMVVLRQRGAMPARRQSVSGAGQESGSAFDRPLKRSVGPTPMSSGRVRCTADRLLPTRGAVIAAFTACLMATLIMRIVMGLPQIPYNVRELFGGEDAWWRFFLFALAGLSIGLGGTLVGHLVVHYGRAYFTLPAGAVVACLVSYLFLVASVSAESLRDVTGSSNTYWFVMNRKMWGDFGMWLYGTVGSQALIQAIEQFVRFTALVGQELLWIAILSAAYFRAIEPSSGGGSRASVAITLGFSCVLAAAPWLILFNLVAFDFSSTDNLNELLDGHGHVSYLLLILLPLNALFVVHAVRRPYPAQVLAAVFVVAVSLPVGWLILKYGLSPTVSKYGKTFSGVDFLLGPDRRDLLPTSVLMARWFVVQSAAVVTLALGINLVPAPLGAR